MGAALTPNRLMLSWSSKRLRVDTRPSGPRGGFVARRAAEDGGWATIPPGTRKSTYDNPEYQKAAPFAAVTLKALQTADPTNPCIRKVPYTGIQFVPFRNFSRSAR